MKQKTRDALRGILKDVAKHEAEAGGPDVTVDLGELTRLLRWAQNKDHIWFKGDRVKWTGVSVPFGWLDEGMEGTVIGESHEDGRAHVEWNGGPENANRVWMYHNEIKRI